MTDLNSFYLALLLLLLVRKQPTIQRDAIFLGGSYENERVQAT